MSVAGIGNGGQLACWGIRACYTLVIRVQLQTMEPDKNYAIDISVRTRFLPEQSDINATRFAFEYTITMENIGAVSATLISRHWWIVDAENVTQEVRGLGVVGQQPLLAPGEQFAYTSGCVISTAVGTMKGSYQWTAADGVEFRVEIPVFVLSMPRTLH